MENILLSDMFFLVVFLLSVSDIRGDVETIKTKYVCPKEFHLVGRKCYHFSSNDMTWHDSHYYCQTLNGTLAVTDNHRDLNLLRDYLNTTAPASEKRHQQLWIDGIYDWKQMRWKWGSSGQLISFNKFSKINRNDKFKWNCIVIDPGKHNRWNARKCTNRHRCICETESNTYIQFKLFNKKVKKNFSIGKCSNPSTLSKYEKKKCLQLLGTVENNEPAYIIEKPRPTKSVTDVDGYVCPSHMIGLGNRCYYFSKEEASWMDAFYECQRNKSKLAIVRNRPQDYNLRIFLNNFIEKHDRWIGGMYDWKAKQWKWAMTGQPLKYKGFAKDILKNRSSENLEWDTIFMDPSLENRWNAANELRKKHYICQVKAKAVKKLGNNKLDPPHATISIITQ